MKFIELTNSARFAIVDDVDYEELSRYSWHLNEPKPGFSYARRSADPRFMHRAVAALAGIDGPVIDHRNGNTLDNRRTNLRACSAAENSWNANKKRGAANCHGVSRAGNGWVVKLMHNKQLRYFGYFTDLDEAKQVASAARAQLRAEFDASAREVA